MTKSIVIIDDHHIILTGLKTVLENNYKIDAAVKTEEELLSYLDSHKDNLPQAAIIDIQLKDQMAFDLIKKLSTEYPSVAVIVHSMFDSVAYTALARNNGAKGFVSKADSQEKLLEALSCVCEGKTFFESSSPDKMDSIDSAMEILTSKEKTVFKHLITGRTNSEISKLMDIKTHTVEKYVSVIYEKLGIKHRNEIFERYN